jgi:glycosyltransferase involved in cell wall biosynthesis
VGLFDAVKGTDVLLRAFAQAFAGRGDVVLEIGGGGPLEPSLRALAAELGIAGQTTFLGLLTRAQVREAMWRADAFVLPSHIETFGVVVIEAMATGLPVASTACGGPQDTVVPGETGLLVPPGDPAALAAAMRRLHAERGAWAARAGSIRRRAEACFSHPVVVRRLLEVYAAARAEFPGGGR